MRASKQERLTNCTGKRTSHDTKANRANGHAPTGRYRVKDQVRTRKASEQARGTHILESAEGGKFSGHGKKASEGTHQLESAQ